MVGRDPSPVLGTAEQALKLIAPLMRDPAVLLGYRPGSRRRGRSDLRAALPPIPRLCAS